MEKRGRERSIQGEMAGPCQALRSHVSAEACELNPSGSKRARGFQTHAQHSHTAAPERTLAPAQAGREGRRENFHGVGSDTGPGTGGEGRRPGSDCGYVEWMSGKGQQ